MLQNIPYSSVIEFVGRDESLAQLHQLLQENDLVGIAGINGIGKTELAIQYVQQYIENYPGGVCWLFAKADDVGPQILTFIRKFFDNFVIPEGLPLKEQIDFCWHNWQPATGNVLIVLDDVVSYSQVEAYLPPKSSQFKVLMTTRLQELIDSKQQLSLEVLTPKSALDLLASRIGKYRVKATRGKGFATDTAQQPIAEQLCEWLGYLPLAIDMVGRYLEQEPNLSLEKMLKRLKQQKLSAQNKDDTSWNIAAYQGVSAAFELSWKRLNVNEEAQELGCLLSIFALAPIPWEQVESVLGQLYLPGAFLGKLLDGSADAEAEIENLVDTLKENWEKARSALIELSLLEQIDEGIYYLHQSIRDLLREKLESLEQADNLKEVYCQVMVAVAEQISEQPTHELIEAVTSAIPHLAEIAITWQNFLSDEDLIKPFTALGNFYESQGAYNVAVPWYENCLTITQSRLGLNHPDVATSLNNLALCQQHQNQI